MLHPFGSFFYRILSSLPVYICPMGVAVLHLVPRISKSYQHGMYL